MKKTEKIVSGLLCVIFSFLTLTGCQEEVEQKLPVPVVSPEENLNNESTETNNGSSNLVPSQKPSQELNKTLDYTELDGLFANLDGVGAIGFNRITVKTAQENNGMPIQKNRLVVADKDTALVNEWKELAFTMREVKNDNVREYTVTQDKINGEIDKIYVQSNYTFLQFVEVSHNSGYACIDGEIPTYCKSDYSSYGDYKTYVMDNETGELYALSEDIFIGRFINGFVTIAGENGDVMCNMTIMNGELLFSPVLKNQSLTIYDIFRDKYGHTYIMNNYLDAYDAETKTVYYTKTCNYILSKEGIAIRLDYNGDYAFNYEELPYSYQQIVKIEEDFSFNTITANEKYQFDYNPLNSNSIHDRSNIVISRIENGFLYMYSWQGYAYSHFSKVNLSTLETQLIRHGVYNNAWEYNCLKSAPIDDSTVLIWSDYAGASKLYYASVWGENAFRCDGLSFSEENLHLLMENIVCEPNWSFDFDELRFRHVTLEETVDYRLIVDNSLPTIVNVEEYQQTQQPTRLLQTIKS